MSGEGAWGVLSLFLIPVGGGIPGGVLLARKVGIPWPGMMALYFVSDVILACVFEPAMLLLLAAGRKISALARAAEALRSSTRRSVERCGGATGAWGLVLVAFGVDPMTGRAAAKAAGHGFLSGWAIAIAGDMMYFTVLMVSTLWLNSILGDGAWTMLLIFAAMFFLPSWIRRARARFLRPAPAS